jgi:hypothetical protein
MVLDAISMGIEDAGKIAKVTKISKAEVEMILTDLAVQKLTVTEQKKGLFGKKIQARITDTGSRLLSFKKQDGIAAEFVRQLLKSNSVQYRILLD